MTMIHQDIYNEIIQSFGALWQYKVRNNTLEIITPYCTTNNKFVSVFLTQRDNYYIVSDGGWISQNIYESIDRDDDNFYQKIFVYYENFFSISLTEANNIKYFYKKTDNKLLIPNLVFDLTNFITAIVSTSMIQLKDEKEEQEKENFKVKADTLLKTISPNVKINKAIDEKNKSIKYSAIVPVGNNLTLINYITGSNHYYYKNSIGRANLYFQIANENYKDIIKDEISFIDDNASGYNQIALSPYLQALEHTTQRPPIPWSLRNELAQYVD